MIGNNQIPSVIRHNWRLKIYSALVGFALWFYVLSTSGEKGRLFQTVPLKVANSVKVQVDSPEARNWQVSPQVVTIYFIPKAMFFRLSEDSFRVTVRPERDQENQASLLPVNVLATEDVTVLKVEPEKVLVKRRKP